MTARQRQALIDHLVEHHDRRLTPTMVVRWTFDRLSRWHANEHYRFGGSLDHFHEGGIGRGPDDRPAGWYTGEAAIPRKKGLNR